MFTVFGLFFISGLAVGALYALGGIGLVILHRATGVLNFAYGALAAAAAMVAWQVASWGAWVPLAATCAIATGIALSVFYGRLIAPLLAPREPAVKAVATLAYMLMLLGIMGLIWDDSPRSLRLPTDAIAVQVAGLRVTLTRMITLTLSVVAVIGMTIYLVRSRMGLNMRALADHRGHAALLGIPILRVETLAWGISGALAGLTGLLFGSLIRLEPSVITFMVIPATAAAICGRLTSLPMTLAGGLIIGVVESLAALSPAIADYRSMVPYLVAGLIILWMQRGTTLTFATKD